MSCMISREETMHESIDVTKKEIQDCREDQKQDGETISPSST